MRSQLLVNFFMALVVTSQSSFRAATLPTSVSSTVMEMESQAVDVSLRTPTDSTISFRSENDPDTTQQIPHLVLKRNGVLTPGFERTLSVSVDHLSIPKSGLFVDLTIDTQHSDPDLGGDKSAKIAIWHGIRFVPYSDGALKSADFRITFNQTVRPEHTTIQTPTDYYGYRLSVTSADGEKLQEIEQDHAFLLENQWQVPLPKVLEDSPEAAPNELVVYYCDMFPFQRDMNDANTRLKRDDVDRYIQTELVPAMVSAFVMQTNLWHMPWYREWKNYRTDEDPKTLSVALGEHKTWYHGPFLYEGNASISIRVDGTFGNYSTLTDGILSVFHHELFHNQQRNISLHFQGNDNLSGKNNAWKMFSEGTAVLASVVGEPDVELAAVTKPRDYIKRAKAFLGEDGLVGGGLNESYSEIPYHTAVYWRFLYEHCGGLFNGIESPDTGMQVIRNVLESLYDGKVVDINSSSDAAGALPEVVDLALQNTPSCEFRTYEESLLQFSEAVFLLRMPSERCNAMMEDSACGFFDPNHLYPTPNAEVHAVAANADTSVQGSIPSSYGMDLMEFKLEMSTSHKAMTILLDTDDGKHNKFCVEVWQIEAIEQPSDSGQAPVHAGHPQSICADGGSATLDIDPANSGNVNAIGVVVTRMDSHETSDPGEYSLQLHRK
jgi:hypothetical protein